MKRAFDVVVVGGGHAGVEAAHAAARLGQRTALVVMNPEKIGAMPCNPAVGGPGKSQMVFELVALGGVMGKLADQTAINTRVLNASKGPAVQSLRVQNDRDEYAWAARDLLETQENLTVIAGEVAAIDQDNAGVSGVVLASGVTLTARAVVLCTGTFLAGVVWYGNRSRPAGRQGEAPANELSRWLRASGHRLRRFSTSTPPRLRADSVDLGALEIVPADDPPGSFAGTPGPRAASTPTWLTHTTAETHGLIRGNMTEAAAYSGLNEGPHPRYCPSIEDKIIRFEDKERHLLFVEPDGTDTSELYLQGFSSGLPPELQDELIRTLPGFSQARIQRYAYAVEYDSVDARELDTSLMSRHVPGLFSAGQINGTSGYEEAAVQGLIAGVNAARFAGGLERVTLKRDEGYIGVLLDELVRWGLDEPYRMLTSRNEHRLLHRQDSAAARLTATGVAWGLVPESRLQEVEASEQRIAAEIGRLSRLTEGSLPLTRVMSRPGVTWADVAGADAPSLTPAEIVRLESLVRYAPYIERAEKERASRAGYERLALHGVDFTRVPGLSNEGRERLEAARPDSLGAAGRLPGMRDSDLGALLVHVRATDGGA